MFVPDFKLSWTGLVAFRSVFDVSLLDNIPGLPEDATHWVSGISLSSQDIEM